MIYSKDVYLKLLSYALIEIRGLIWTEDFPLITQSLYEVGFNPLQTTKTIKPLYKKYGNNPEVKTIFREINTR